jgi:class 3 adenylate cyclase
VDSNYKAYDHLASVARIDGILAQPQGNYEEVKSLPDRDKLTFTNGFYAYCSALFIDIRDSSKLPDLYERPVLAKLYRAFISEIVAVMNGNTNAREINIVGDCVWGVFNTPKMSDIDDVFRTAYTANSLIQVLNYKLDKNGYKTGIRCGLGMSYGRALMIKAGYNGSGINDVVYMGDVVNRAAKLASQGSKNFKPPFMVDDVFRGNLKEHNQGLLTWDSGLGCYTGNVVNTTMEDWYHANCT